MKDKVQIQVSASIIMHKNLFVLSTAAIAIAENIAAQGYKVIKYLIVVTVCPPW